MVVYTIEQHFIDKTVSKCTATEKDLDIAMDNIHYMIMWLSKHPRLDHIFVCMTIEEDQNGYKKRIQQS
jgi:hypothetical protein